MITRAIDIGSVCHAEATVTTTKASHQRGDIEVCPVAPVALDGVPLAGTPLINSCIYLTASDCLWSHFLDASPHDMARREVAEKELAAEPDTAETTAANESYDEDEDDDYNPDAKPAPGAEAEEDDDDKNEPTPDFSAIESGTERLVMTRRQRQQHDMGAADRHSGLVPASGHLDVDDIFEEMKSQSTHGQVSRPLWVPPKEEDAAAATPAAAATAATAAAPADSPDMITISSSYTFAGKIITETKQVEANSAEARAYLNSTGNLAALQAVPTGGKRSFVPVVRQVDGEHVELRIKLKRPSLIDKFLAVQGNKLQKLSTLEKSRLDWASFVDKRKLQDDLKLHNKAGYLDKQEFLNRVELKRDAQYKAAQEADRKQRLDK